MSTDVELTVRRAYSDLRYIREVLEGAGTFTAVPGKGLMAMGAVGLAAAFADAWIGRGLADAGAWWESAAWVWGLAFLIAGAVGSWTMTAKARRLGSPLNRGPFVKAIRGLMPPIIMGGVLTAAVVGSGAGELVPGVWLSMYGIAVLAGGLFSVRPVRVMGSAFAVLGAVALLARGLPPHMWLGIGFGAFHVVFGAWIASRHDG
ncbi:MAG: hypothetical protein N3A38_06835 [Planctomycetota bacterium]|nr:hypothetical protein [Planctomycetota bacterium]